MNKQISAQEAASMSQDDFDKLDDGLIDSLLTGDTSRESEPAPAPEHSEPAHAEPPLSNGHDQEAKQKAEDEDHEAITIDEDGRARNAKGKFVPHAALHKERETHKATRAERDNLRVENAKVSERLAMLLQALEPERPAQQAAPEEPQITPISVEDDLIGALKQMQEFALKGRGQTAPEVRQLQQRIDGMEAHHQVTAISNRYASDVQAARANTAAMPGFEDAVRHLVMQQDAMLAAQGWTDPAARRNEIQAAERNFVLKAYKENANPAVRLYDMAKAVGWKPAATNGANGANGAHNGAAQPSQVEQRIDNIAKMQKSSPSLSNVAGSGGDSLPSPQQVAAMSDEDFDAFVDKVGGMKAFERRYMGRER
jgi:hypothetical protein